MATANTSKKIAPLGDALEEIFIPRSGMKDEPDMFISVNGTNYLLPRGKTHKVPAAVAAEFRRSQAAQERYEASADVRRFKG